MFRLIKLAAYGLLGYAMFEFVRGALGPELDQAWDRLSRAEDERSGGGRPGARASRNLHDQPNRANMTGPGLFPDPHGEQGVLGHAVGLEHRIAKGHSILKPDPTRLVDGARDYDVAIRSKRGSRKDEDIVVFGQGQVGGQPAGRVRERRTQLGAG